jgi:plastocyanin
MNAFLIAGAVLAVWAVLVALLGMRGFPRNRGGERTAIAITVVLFVGAVGSAIADTTKVGERKGPEEAGHAAPAEGAAPAQPGAKATTLTLSADPAGALKFDKAALEAPAGAVTIDMTNPAPVPHDISLRGPGVDEQGKQVSDGGKSTVQADLKAGSYEFYCSVPGHEQAGMKGTLTVK